MSLCRLLCRYSFCKYLATLGRLGEETGRGAQEGAPWQPQGLPNPPAQWSWVLGSWGPGSWGFGAHCPSVLGPGSSGPGVLCPGSWAGVLGSVVLGLGLGFLCPCAAWLGWSAWPGWLPGWVWASPANAQAAQDKSDNCCTRPQAQNPHSRQ